MLIITLPPAVLELQLILNDVRTMNDHKERRRLFHLCFYLCDASRHMHFPLNSPRLLFSLADSHLLTTFMIPLPAKWAIGVAPFSFNRSMIDSLELVSSSLSISSLLLFCVVFVISWPNGRIVTHLIFLVISKSLDRVLRCLKLL